MCNIQYIGFSWPKAKRLVDRVKAELTQMGYSHLFNESDYQHFLRLRQNERRRTGKAANLGRDAMEIAHAIIDDRPQALNQFDELLND